MTMYEIEWGDHLDFPSTRSGNRLTHIVGGRYPCRSVAAVPRLILMKEFGGQCLGVNVLDPFMGSGTTALETRLVAGNPFGLEVDPYARLVASASSHAYSEAELRKLEHFQSRLPRLARQRRRFRDYVPALENIELWFPEENIKMLASLRALVDDEFSVRSNTRRLVLAAFADIVRASSRAERQSLKPYVSRRFPKTPGVPEVLFERALKHYISAARSFSEIVDKRSSALRWLSGDATQFASKEVIDVAITSPPYINAMDYVRCIRLESSWVGTGDTESFRGIRQSQIGEAARTRISQSNPDVIKKVERYTQRIRRIDSRRASVVESYFSDMYENIRCVRDVLRPGSSYFVIVGDSVIRDVPVPTHKILAQLGEILGMKWSGYFKYNIKDHRTSIPRRDRGGKINVEHVIQLTRKS